MFMKEDYALVLEFLPFGRTSEARQEPIAQVIGEQYFTLLEVITKPGAALSAFERVYIGRDAREKVERIKRRIVYRELTNSAQKEVEIAIRKLISQREPEFVSFLNKAGSISIRAHSLELLPNIGKKNLEAILTEREKKPFSSLSEVKIRVPHVANIEEDIVKRIIQELGGEEKYYLFVKIPPKSPEEREQEYRERRY